MAPAMAFSSVSTESWDLTNFVVHQGHGVKGLAERGLKTLPKQYIQPLKERLDTKKVVLEESIPVIDMLRWEDDPTVAESICDAAEKWGFDAGLEAKRRITAEVILKGFFQIINHGVDVQVLEKAKAATNSFFGMPAADKLKYSKENSPTNNVRFGTSFIPQAEASLEWKDFLSLFYVSEDEAATYWPPACKNEAIEFMTESNFLIKRLLKALMGRLNVKEIDEEKELLLMGSKRINMNYYPKCPNPELTVGVGRHSDVSTLTILLQDDIGGLYVKKLEEDSWVHVPPISGSLVINIGDALQIMSNGRYKSIEHRVVANGSNNRVSVPIFVNPRPDDVIGPLPEVLENGKKPLYKQVLYSDYVKHFFRKAHDGKETVDFAKI